MIQLAEEKSASTAEARVERAVRVVADSRREGSVNPTADVADQDFVREFDGAGEDDSTLPVDRHIAKRERKPFGILDHKLAALAEVGSRLPSDR